MELEKSAPPNVTKTLCVHGLCSRVQRAQLEVAVCNTSGLKIKLVDTVLVERQVDHFVEVWFFFLC